MVYSKQLGASLVTLLVALGGFGVSFHSVIAAEEVSAETWATCNDGLDNDGDGAIDLADSDCASFLPTLKIVKHVDNTNGGTRDASSFTLYVARDEEPIDHVNGSEEGSYVTSQKIGNWKVTEGEPLNGYVASYGGDCDESGVVTMDFNTAKTCTVTNTFVPAPENNIEACNDGYDNDGDGAKDLADLDCVLFRPTLTLTKSIVGGVASASDFFVGVFRGVDLVDYFPGAGDVFDITSTMIGDWSIVQATSTVTANYALQFSGDCDLNGQLAMPFNTHKNCTLTNTFSGSTDTPIQNPPASTGGSGGGSSNFDYWGCTDLTATNFNPLANKNDGSCQYGGNGSGEVAGTSTTNTTDSGGGTSTSTTGNTNGTESAASSTGGEVLGDATLSCTPYMTAFIRADKKNDPAQVKLLQEFLNKYEGANLPVNGIYGPLTWRAVNAFQVKYGIDVLKPWLPFGHKSITIPTGVVYKTTRWKINSIVCAAIKAEELPVPQLP